MEKTVWVCCVICLIIFCSDLSNWQFIDNTLEQTQLIAGPHLLLYNQNMLNDLFETNISFLAMPITESTEIGFIFGYVLKKNN